MNFTPEGSNIYHQAHWTLSTAFTLEGTFLEIIRVPIIFRAIFNF